MAQKEVLNKNVDLGALLVEDCESFVKLSDEQLLKRTQENLCLIYKELFDLKKKQKALEGEDGEILEYTKAKFAVALPPSNYVLPREKPIPKPKPLTKWERFRLEKGIQAKEKRSRLVFDPITKDFVPRYGMGSIKKIEDKHNWLMEEKPEHVAAGMDPFTYQKQEKKLQKEKQDLRELKNQISNQDKARKDLQVLQAQNDTGKEEGEITEEPKKMTKGQTLKLREDGERDKIRKRERKALLKSLQLAQISTGSMGKFDKKVNKHEPDAPKSLKAPKKKSNVKLHTLETNKSLEKDRNLKLLNLMQREKELKAGGKVESAMDK